MKGTSWRKQPNTRCRPGQEGRSRANQLLECEPESWLQPFYHSDNKRPSAGEARSLAPGLTSRGAGRWTDPYGWLRWILPLTISGPATHGSDAERAGMPGLTILEVGGPWMARGTRSRRKAFPHSPDTRCRPPQERSCAEPHHPSSPTKDRGWLDKKDSSNSEVPLSA